MSAVPADNSDEVDDPAVAGELLLSLRGAGLIRSWQIEGSSFVVLVGRGTVRVPALDVAGVVRLAEVLRRDKVSVVGRGTPVMYRTTRYRLCDGRFADRHDGRVGRYLDDFPYTVFVPGADPSGCAAEHFAARTLREAVALAGLVRLRGRCTVCGTSRPLQVDRYRPDPTIPCPGCGADATGPVTVLCHRCTQPITRNPHPGDGAFRVVWQHLDTGRPDCDTTPSG